jgi:hypothetical protein
LARAERTAAPPHADTSAADWQLFGAHRIHEPVLDFTGSHEPDYPAGQPTLGQMLAQAVVAKEQVSGVRGPLVLVVGSDIYVYESTGGARLSQERFRTATLPPSLTSRVDEVVE